MIGGGLGGCLVTMELLKRHAGIRICMVEKKPEHLARGVAYAKHFTGQLLNVPVAGMSVDPETPLHFYNWLTANAVKYPHLEFDAASFVPRSIYGDYVEEQFKAITDSAGERFSVVFDEAEKFERSGSNITVSCKRKETIQAKFMVLATGNLPPADILVKTASFLQSPRYISNPWTPGVIRNLETHQNVLIIGSGLTAIDIVLALYDQKHVGNIGLLSRRGKLPLPHTPGKPYQFSQPELLLSGNITTIVRALRNELKKCGEGISWQHIMDSIRPYTQQAWMNMSLEQKKIFLSRFRGFWEIHRHRVPASSLNKINEMKSKGQLVHYTGNICDAAEGSSGVEVFYQHRNKMHSLKVDMVINCTGPESNFRKHNLPLLIDMMKKGCLVSDELNMGIGCNEEGKVLNDKGQPDELVYCMGHLRKGTLWETTAVRELREQAREIAQTIKVNS